MKKFIQSESARALIVAVAVFICLAFLPEAQALSPAPDGGYPNFTTAEGQNALLNLTTGIGNSAVGSFSLFSNATGSFNTAVGAGALDLNTGDENTATGAAALLLNTTGVINTATGVDALAFNDTGDANTADGAAALFNNIGGSDNTAIGFAALAYSNASFNTALGSSALNLNTSGEQNTAVGDLALNGNTMGSFNTAMGEGALEANTTGSSNVALGFSAGSDLTTGDNNIDIGNEVLGVDGESNTIRIGNFDITTTYIRGISGATASGGAAVFVNSNGQLGTLTSSARFKDEIKPMDKASEAILGLRPVTFRYKKQIDPQRISQFGLVAEEVEKVNPDLVVRDTQGRPQTVRYEQINAMLLNEFLKEHRKVQELDANAAVQQKEISLLRSELKEQRALMQRVSDKVELIQAAPETVASDR